MHDLRKERKRKGSIVGIWGTLTDRRIGGGMSELGLRLLAAGADAPDSSTYSARSPSGRMLRSTTVLIRGEDQRPAAAVCVNVDVTALMAASGALRELVGDGGEDNGSGRLGDLLLSDSPELVIERAVQQGLGRAAAQAASGERELRRSVLRGLDAAGIFYLRGSVPEVARRLGTSRATIYNELAAIRDESGDARVDDDRE